MAIEFDIRIIGEPRPTCGRAGGIGAHLARGSGLERRRPTARKPEPPPPAQSLNSPTALTSREGRPRPEGRHSHCPRRGGRQARSRGDHRRLTKI